MRRKLFSSKQVRKNALVYVDTDKLAIMQAKNAPVIRSLGLIRVIQHAELIRNNPAVCI